MRISWKTVADNLVIYMDRETMVRARDGLQERLLNEKHFSLHEKSGLVQTIRFLNEAILEYDEAFGED